MKLYCELCSKTQPVRIDNCRDAKTNEPYQDIVCAECDFVIASGTDIAQPEQEPVAWMHIEKNEIVSFETDKEECEKCEHCVPLYTAPSKREWVGLTNEEVETFKQSCHLGEVGYDTFIKRFAIGIEAKLKEKNGGNQ